jgi:hypothetical protein
VYLHIHVLSLLMIYFLLLLKKIAMCYKPRDIVKNRKSFAPSTKVNAIHG